MEKENPPLPQLLQDSRTVISRRLEAYFHEQRQNTSNDLEQTALERLLDMASGGKMLRGTLVIIGYSLSGRQATDSVLDVACGMELTHTGLLIHDDIMDHDAGRRGKVAMHRRYEQDEPQIDNKTHYGISQGISVGDIAIFMGMECFAKAIQKDTYHQDILGIFAREMIQVGYGQMRDVRYGQTDKEPSEEEIISVYRRKTAGYSFALPLVLGGTLAGLSDETLAFLKDFGINTGIAFQIKDDELGVFGDEKTLGKPVGSDIRENKKTLLRAKLFAKATKEEVSKLNTLYGSDAITSEDVASVRELHNKYQVREYAASLADAYTDRARELITKANLIASQKALFSEILDFTTGRTK